MNVIFHFIVLSAIFILSTAPAYAGARDRIIDPETSYLAERKEYLSKYQSKRSNYETRQVTYLGEYKDYDSRLKSRQKSYLGEHQTREDALMNDAATYLLKHQNRRDLLEARQREFLPKWNKRHRDYLEIDEPGPELYFPHDD